MKYCSIFIGAFLFTSCGQGNLSEKKGSFADARKSFTTKIVKTVTLHGEPETPPAELFRLVAYPGPIGNMPAYLSNIPQDGKLRPAMIWITGGWGNDIGDVWTPQDAEDDQSAAAIGEAGVIMMYPAQRGGNTSPGSDEICYGEIDDIIAAAQYLAKQPGVDPKRIYLGGHSTGGTKVMLAAEASKLFRATFSFGPAAEIQDYGTEEFTFEKTRQELEMRSPAAWLSSLSTPLFVFEGTDGNLDGLKYLEDMAQKEHNTFAHFYELKGEGHFSGLQKSCKLIGEKIIADSGSVVNIKITSNDLH